MKRTPLRFVRLPSRFLPGEWPVEMRSDVVAAFLDFPDTRSLAFAIERGEAPRPTSMRKTGSKRFEPIWSAEAVADFVRRRHSLFSETPSSGAALAKLVAPPTLVLRQPTSGS